MAYLKPPIREAVFDIRIDKLPTSALDELKNFNKELSGEFPKIRARFSYTGNLRFSTDAPPKTEAASEPTGFQFITESGNKLLQVTLDGIAYNIIRDYRGWELHFEQFQAYWDIFKRLFNPQVVERTGSRFINECKFVIKEKRIEDFINYSPHVSKKISENVNNFFMQTQVAFAGDNSAIIKEFVDISKAENTTLILDIDVYNTRKILITDYNLDDYFPNIREIKNQIFEDYFTNKAKELFG